MNTRLPPEVKGSKFIMYKKLQVGSMLMVVLLMLSVAFGGAKPAQADAAQNMSARVVGFYKWYVGKIKADKRPLNSRETMRQYTSRRLWKWLNSQAYAEFGADYFLDAQDFDNDWDQARVSNVRIKGQTATLTASLGRPKPRDKGIGVHTLKLRLVKEAGVWKIDRVNGN
jgi:hypothetical protein